MTYDEKQSQITKKRLMQLRKEKKLSFEQLSKALADRGTYISHTNLKNYEISDTTHPLYGRTRSMSIEYLVGFADFYQVSVGYLLGMSKSKKPEYHDISQQLGLSDEAIEKLIYRKELSEERSNSKLPMERDTTILNDFITSDSFDYVLDTLKHSLFATYMHKLSQNAHQEFLRQRNDDDLAKAKELLAKHGYFAVENDVVADVQMANVIKEIEGYLSNLIVEGD